MARARKVYYDILLNGTSASQVVNLANADRFGNTLDALAALTYGADGGDKARRELTCWFVPALQTDPVDISGRLTVSYWIDFMRNTTLFAPYLTAGGASVAAKAGLTSIYIANPRVRVSSPGLEALAETRGTLHVQRQHSIEV